LAGLVFKQFATNIRNDSNLFSARSISLTKKLTVPLLLTAHEYKVDQNHLGEFLAYNDPNFDQNLQEYFGIVSDRYQKLGTALRSLVITYQEEPVEQDVEALLKRIEELR